MEDIFEIKDTDVDVELIMGKIREAIESKKKEGLYSEEEVSRAERLKLSDEPKGGEFIEHYLRTAGVLCNIEVDRYKFGIPPSLNKPVLGHMVLALKSFIRRVLRFHTRAIFKQQIDFNRHIVQLMNGLYDRMEQLEREIFDLRAKLERQEGTGNKKNIENSQE